MAVFQRKCSELYKERYGNGGRQSLQFKCWDEVCEVYVDHHQLHVPGKSLCLFEDKCWGAAYELSGKASYQSVSS